VIYFYDGHEIATNVCCCCNDDDDDDDDDKLLEKGAKNQSEEITGVCESFEELIARLLFSKDITGKLGILFFFTRSFAIVTGYLEFF
jgi:hypothetical protein